MTGWRLGWLVVPEHLDAVVDALKDYGVRHIDMPATPQKIWAIVNGGHRMAAE